MSDNLVNPGSLPGQPDPGLAQPSPTVDDSGSQGQPATPGSNDGQPLGFYEEVMSKGKFPTNDALAKSQMDGEVHLRRLEAERQALQAENTRLSTELGRDNINHNSASDDDDYFDEENIQSLLEKNKRELISAVKEQVAPVIQFGQDQRMVETQRAEEAIWSQKRPDLFPIFRNSPDYQERVRQAGGSVETAFLFSLGQNFESHSKKVYENGLTRGAQRQAQVDSATLLPATGGGVQSNANNAEVKTPEQEEADRIFSFAKRGKVE